MNYSGDSLHSDQSKRIQQWPKRVFLIILLGLGLALAGCQSIPLDKSLPKPAISQQNTGTDYCGIPPQKAVQKQQPLTGETDDSWARLRKGFRLWGVSHPKIQQEIKRLQRSPQAFDTLIARARPYLHYILEQVKTHDLPAELALLPAVESGFKPYAYSSQGAAGLWQFMPATGKMLGLRQNWWMDERRSVDSSTEAALTYLIQLNKQMGGNWLHTLAAYNAGAGTLRRAIRKAKRKGKKTDFWSLDLPRETKTYVPRLLAFAEIINDPGRYGLALPLIPHKPYFLTVDSKGQIDLQVAAKLAGIPLQDLLALNPGFNRWSTAPQGPHELQIPRESVEQFRQNLASLPQAQRMRWQRYRIRTGDNLGGIAHKFNVSVVALKQTNNLKGTGIRAGKHLLIPLSESVTAQLPRNLGLPKSRVRYQVRKGDSLYRIANKFRVKIADLRRWNKLGRYLKPGQRLTIYVNPGRTASHSQATSQSI